MKSIQYIFKYFMFDNDGNAMFWPLCKKISSFIGGSAVFAKRQPNIYTNVEPKTVGFTIANTLLH